VNEIGASISDTQLNSTQLNSTNHPKIKEWFNKRKEAKKAYIYPDSLVNSQDVF